MPPTIADRTPRPGDERFATVTARRAVLEWVLGHTAAEEPGVEVRRGTEAEALLARRADGLPHITGVRTTAGDELTADLVVDRDGPPLPPARAARGPRRPARARGGRGPRLHLLHGFSPLGRRRAAAVRAALLTPFSSFSLLTLPPDRGTWSVTVYVSAATARMKAVRDADAWSAPRARVPGPRALDRPTSRSRR
jgi:hypothetical protein